MVPERTHPVTLICRTQDQAPLRGSASRSADPLGSWPVGPAVIVPAAADECTHGDDGGGQVQVGLHHDRAAFGAPAQFPKLFIHELVRSTGQRLVRPIGTRWPRGVTVAPTP